MADWGKPSNIRQCAQGQTKYNKTIMAIRKLSEASYTALIFSNGQNLILLRILKIQNYSITALQQPFLLFRQTS